MKNKFLYISFFLLLIIGCFNSKETSDQNTTKNIDLSKVECTNKLEAYIFQAESLDQDGINLI